MALDTEIVTPLTDVLHCLRHDWRPNPWVSNDVKQCSIEFLAAYIKHGYLEGMMQEFGYSRRFVPAEELEEHRKRALESNGRYFYTNPYHEWHVLSEQFHGGKKVFLMTDDPAKHRSFQSMCRYFAEKPETEYVPHAHIALEGVPDIIEKERPEFLRRVYLDPKSHEALREHSPEKVGRLLEKMGRALSPEERMDIIEDVYPVAAKAAERVPRVTRSAPAVPAYANVTYK